MGDGCKSRSTTTTTEAGKRFSHMLKGDGAQCFEVVLSWDI